MTRHAAALAGRARAVRAVPVVSLVARLGLATVWLVSGALKAVDPAQTYLAVVAYRVLPPAVIPAVAAGLPLSEIAVGVLLLLGLSVRTGAVLSTVLLLVFIAGVAQAWARGLAIDCGCFGGGGAVPADQTSYGLEVLRDLGFLLLAGWLLRFPATPASLDSLLRRSTRRAGSERDDLGGTDTEPSQARSSMRPRPRARSGA